MILASTDVEQTADEKAEKRGDFEHRLRSHDEYAAGREGPARGDQACERSRRVRRFIAPGRRREAAPSRIGDRRCSDERRKTSGPRDDA